ncbi:hypothetical protein MMPV_000229 [Pyropia vietnamensis]
MFSHGGPSSLSTRHRDWRRVRRRVKAAAPLALALSAVVLALTALYLAVGAFVGRTPAGPSVRYSDGVGYGSENGGSDGGSGDGAAAAAGLTADQVLMPRLHAIAAASAAAVRTHGGAARLFLYVPVDSAADAAALPAFLAALSADGGVGVGGDRGSGRRRRRLEAVSLRRAPRHTVAVELAVDLPADVAAAVAAAVATAATAGDHAVTLRSSRVAASANGITAVVRSLDALAAAVGRCSFGGTRGAACPWDYWMDVAVGEEHPAGSVARLGALLGHGVSRRPAMLPPSYLGLRPRREWAAAADDWEELHMDTRLAWNTTALPAAVAAAGSGDGSNGGVFHTGFRDPDRGIRAAAVPSHGRHAALAAAAAVYLVHGDAPTRALAALTHCHHAARHWMGAALAAAPVALWHSLAWSDLRCTGAVAGAPAATQACAFVAVSSAADRAGMDAAAVASAETVVAARALDGLLDARGSDDGGIV